MKNILITGGAGFIGSNFAKIISQNKKYFVLILDKLTYAGDYKSISKLIDQNNNIVFFKGDIASKNLVKNLFFKYKFDTVFNFAAETHVDNSIDDPSVFLKTNINGTYNLLLNSYNYWKEKKIKNHLFFHISTDEVFGSLKKKERAFSESSKYEPNSPYSASKASSDHLVRSFNKTFNLRTVISNCSNNYGPYQNIEKLIPKVITNILTNKKIPVYGRGNQIRDWIHVNDHCKGILLIAKSQIVGETFNIGGNNEIKNIEIVKLICKRLFEIKNRSKITNKLPFFLNDKDPKQLIKNVKDRPGHDYRYAINSNKIQKTLKFKTEINFIEGLNNTIDWYIDNFNWWKNQKK